MSGIKVITIDGPAGAGKSTVAKRLAQELSFSYLDTGAMYRALTLKALRLNVEMENEEALLAIAKETQLDLQNGKDGSIVILDGEDISQEIRTLEVTNNTHYVARAPKVREVMVQWQRDIGSSKSVVIEGRDVGTVVFPNATHKFFLDANIEERTRRRADELRAKGKEIDNQQLMQEIKERDHRDTSREAGPLKKAEDAIYIDSTQYDIDGVIQKMLSIIQSHG